MILFYIPNGAWTGPLIALVLLDYNVGSTLRPIKCANLEKLMTFAWIYWIENIPIMEELNSPKTPRT